MAKTIRKSKVDKIIDNLYPDTGSAEFNAKRRRKIAERTLMVLAIIGTISVMSLYSDLIERLIIPEVDKSLVYGIWTEKDVASYAQDKFTVGSGGISVNGAIVATDFDFDGRYLEYVRGGKSLKYKFSGQDYSEMKLVSPAHYSPTFTRRMMGSNVSKGIRPAY